MMHPRLRPLAVLGACLAAAFSVGFGSPLLGQTITGTLMEVDSDRAISLGLIILMTESGDSVTSGVTNAQGRFSLTAPEGGSFLVIASAFGFKETSAGVFEIGGGGEMNIEFRIAPAPMPIDGILIGLQRPVLQHNLITSGFVRRITRGFGRFITPYTIENSTARTSAELFRGIPGVFVNPIGGGGGPSAFMGGLVQMASMDGFCNPTMYVDGIRMPEGMVIDNVAPIDVIDAVEIYRRASEIPIEYAMTATGSGRSSGVCGVLVIWTKRR